MRTIGDVFNIIGIIIGGISLRVAWKARKSSRKEPILSVFYNKGSRIITNQGTAHGKNIKLKILDLYINKSRLPNHDDEGIFREHILTKRQRLQGKEFNIGDIRINQNININFILKNEKIDQEYLSIYNEIDKINELVREKRLETEEIKSENEDEEEDYNNNLSYEERMGYGDYLNDISKIVICFTGSNNFKQESSFQQ